MPGQNTCRIVEGRLMEIDVAAGYNTPADVDAMIASIGRTLLRAPQETRVVIAADWRPCKLFTPNVAERVVHMLTRDNARIERSAILHRADQAISVLQVMRLIRQGRHPFRQVFDDSAAAQRFLREVLNEGERMRLRMFLGAPEAAAAARRG